MAYRSTRQRDVVGLTPMCELINHFDRQGVVVDIITTTNYSPTGVIIDWTNDYIVLEDHACDDMILTRYIMIDKIVGISHYEK
jgi:hypothetical protein